MDGEEGQIGVIEAPTSLLWLVTILGETPFPMPREKDFLRLADELEQNPPADLTPDTLSLVLHILRGEELDCG